MTEHVDAVVIGAGQSGLCTSYYLARHGVPHVVLEQHRVAESWRRRWDSFCLVTPNRLNALPGLPSGGAPDGFLTRDEVVRYLEQFAASFSPPVREGVRVDAVVPQPEGDFLVESQSGPLRCAHVVIATNIFQTPRPPAMAAALAPDIVQLHSDAYRNPAQLPAGAVLVVGSGQSGAQIAEELHAGGRRVYLSVSRAGRLPRRHRGRDMMDWIRIFRAWEQTVDQLDSPADRNAARPHVTGRAGGHSLNLRAFGRAGMVLLGKVTGVAGDRVTLADDVEANLRKADDFATNLCAAIDAGIDKAELDIEPATADELAVDTWTPREVLRELSLRDAGITSVVWATGYPIDFSWIRGLPIDAYGYPVHTRGVTNIPGLYFAALPWLHKHKSSSLYGAAEDAEYVVQHLRRRLGSE